MRHGTKEWVNMRLLFRKYSVFILHENSFRTFFQSLLRSLIKLKLCMKPFDVDIREIRIDTPNKEGK